jgi:phenylalanyl-tRNA synthetase beta chain
MYISLNWIKAFVDLPADLTSRELAERFTLVTAEVEGVVEITIDATGLVVAEIKSYAPLPDNDNLHAVTLHDGTSDRESVTQAAGLTPGDRVIYAPPGARVGGIGELAVAEVAGRRSEGMILPGEALGMSTAEGEAIRLPASMAVGEAIDASRWLDDWVIEVDNKSITHRPDLWGHYGIAREFAAIYKQPLAPLPVVPIESLSRTDRPEIPIVIDDPVKCPRYTGLMMSGLRPQPAPLWMQVRLAHVGMRPINLLVDLTNYVMAELGQPMHAFDGQKVKQIEVAVAQPGEKFTTLDGIERAIPPDALMIQSQRRSVALAGVMGGAGTDVTDATTDLLLESANFEPATIRRCAAALSHRTDAAARFEKSLDPAHTVLAIQRFVELARPELPELEITSRLSDCYPQPPEPRRIEIDLAFLDRFVGRPVDRTQIREILEALEFGVHLEPEAATMTVDVPSFRAARDITMEADVIEEIARYVGYDRIEPRLPEVTLRSVESSTLHRLERQSLELLTRGFGYCEVHNYIWYDTDWLKQLKYEPGTCVELRNPVAAGLQRLRRELVPGLLAMMDRNRHHFERFDQVEVGSVFVPDGDEARHVGLLGVDRRDEDGLLATVKTTIESWSRQVLGRSARFVACTGDRRIWESDPKTAEIRIGDISAGRISVVPTACRLTIDEHLRRLAVVTAEIDLSALLDLPPADEPLTAVSPFPQIEMDFSVLADASRRYHDLTGRLAEFEHPLLRTVTFVGAYEGKSVGQGKRSFTFRAVLGDASRTLTEADANAFRDAFIGFLIADGLELRQ